MFQVLALDLDPITMGGKYLVGPGGISFGPIIGHHQILSDLIELGVKAREMAQKLRSEGGEENADDHVELFQTGPLLPFVEHHVRCAGDDPKECPYPHNDRENGKEFSRHGFGMDVTLAGGAHGDDAELEGIEEREPFKGHKTNDGKGKKKPRQRRSKTPSNASAAIPW